MAATIARLHGVGLHKAGAELESWPSAALSSTAEAEDRLLGRLAAVGAVALLMALLLGLLVGEYFLVWQLLFAPWTHGAPIFMR